MGYRFPVLTIEPRKKYSIYRNFTPLKSKKNGSPFLKTEKSTWWDVNGFLIQVFNWKIMFLFKRRG